MFVAQAAAMANRLRMVDWVEKSQELWM